MSITTEILRIKGGKSDIRTLAVQKNMGTIPTTARIDDYAQYLNEHFPNFTHGVTYDGTKIRGKTEKWNQLLTSVERLSNGTTYINCIFTIPLDGTNNFRISANSAENNKLLTNHKYLILYDYISGTLDGDGSSVSIQLYGSDVSSSTSLFTGVLQSNAVIINYQRDSSTFYFRFRNTTGITSSDLKFMLSLIDLTDIFRAGNEPTSIDDERLQKLIAYAKDHPEYDTGSLAYSFYKGTKLGEYDYIDTANTKLVLGGAEVDISQMSLTRFLFGSNYLFYGTNNDQETNTTNIISADYQTVASISDIPDMSVTGNGGTGKNLWFRDDSCTTVEQFKTKNAGKKVYYKLATPIEIDLS